MLMRTDSFRDFDRLTEAVLGTATRSSAIPMTAYRDDQVFVVQLDLPGATAESIDLTVEQNVLTIRAERHAPSGDAAGVVLDERRYGTFSRQLFLGESLDVDALSADYDSGVLTLRIPIAEKAKPRRVEIGTRPAVKEIDAAA